MDVSKVKSARSVKSIRSMRSSIQGKLNDTSTLETNKMEFEDYLPLICQKFQCAVIVRKDYRRDDFYKMLKQSQSTKKYKRINIVTPSNMWDSITDINRPDDFTDDTADIAPAVGSKIIVTTLYDYLDHMTEIIITRSSVPRTLMQVIGLLVPYYDYLTKISICKCCIDVYTIYELNKMLPLSSITEICLDESTLLEANYAILLDKHSHLQNLSLCRCRINDKVCELIASKLHYTTPAERNLLVLSLSSNHITDVGAKSIGEALRTNRHLRYLNLADNRIGDEGAGYILDTLIDFPLTHDEILNKRKRYMQFLTDRQSLYLRYLGELETRSLDEMSCKSTATKKGKSSAALLRNKIGGKKEHTKTDECLSVKANMLAADVMGLFDDPFNPNSIKTKDGYSYCYGNMVVCYLNLSHNDLSYVSIKKLHKVLTYQSLIKNLNQSGLIKVVIDGNRLPVNCREFQLINDMINKVIGRNIKPDFGRRKSRAFKTKLNE